MRSWMATKKMHWASSPTKTDGRYAGKGRLTYGEPLAPKRHGVSTPRLMPMRWPVTIGAGPAGGWSAKGGACREAPFSEPSTESA